MLHQVRFAYVGKDGDEEVSEGHKMEYKGLESLLETHTFNSRPHWHHTNQWLLSYSRSKNGGSMAMGMLARKAPLKHQIMSI